MGVRRSRAKSPIGSPGSRAATCRRVTHRHVEGPILDATDLARLQFASTSICHFFFVPVTIGLAFLLALLHTRWYQSHETRDECLTPPRRPSARPLCGGVRGGPFAPPRQLPQAFSHLALIEAAARIILADRLEEMSLA